MSRILWCMPRRAALLVVSSLAFACAPATPAAERPSGGAAAALEEVRWQDRSSIYEVFIRDFSPSADLRGLIQGLDRIEATGANVVWLMPIHPVGEVNRKGTLGSSYSVRDYRAINPAYGDAEDFRALVDAVHRRGMKLIIDWVPNHTAWDHAWLREHPEWYTRDASGEITEPLNDDGSSTDWTDVADLNYGSPALRRAMIEAMRYWLEEFDIDGYRVDVAAMVPDDFWREALPRLRAAGAELLLAEAGEARMHELGFDLTYGWEGYHTLKEVWRGEQPASALIERELSESAAVPDGGRLRFTTNHDETAWDEPPVVLFGGSAGARAAFTAIALLPGTPLLYNGQEVESPQQLGLFERELIDWSRDGGDEARAYYRRVIELARSHPSFIGTGLRALATDAPDDVIAYRRGNAVVLVNPRTQSRQFRVTDARVDGARELLSGRVQQGGTVTLAPHSAIVMELQP
ncbi:MAG TPA: alpha-amylase family glycosyl hydrolase [Longimicrobiales bacterium]|nr:alpha-amylase family glycosyl hydrolase [Longimicrobiales bacterium]